MFSKGQVCIKIAGRDAGQACVILESDGRYALVDGHTRKRKVNIAHLEPTEKTLEVSGDLDKALSDLGFVGPKKGKKREAKPRQVKQKVQHKEK